MVPQRPRCVHISARIVVWLGDLSQAVANVDLPHHYRSALKNASAVVKVLNRQTDLHCSAGLCACLGAPPDCRAVHVGAAALTQRVCNVAKLHHTGVLLNMDALNR